MSLIQLNTELLYTWVVRGMVLLTAMPVHECAHALVADKLGDDTSRKRGRLTLNPFVHLDLLGSVLLIFSGFGWAKPVPIDTRKFKHPRRDMALSAVAGPISNILMALVLMIVFKVLALVVDTPALRYARWVSVLLDVLVNMLIVNLYLAVFNLLPVPPLDGSKFFGALLPDHLYFTMMRYERYIMIVLFILMFSGVFSRPLQILAGYLLQFLDFITRPISLLAGLGG